MEYHTEGPQKGHIKVSDAAFPQTLFGKNGSTVQVLNKQQKEQYLATGEYATKVYDKDVHK